MRRVSATHESTEGNRGDLVLRRVRDGVADFLVISLWDGETAVRRFAGPNPDVAVYFPEDDRFLLEKEPHCDHYEIRARPVEPRTGGLSLASARRAGRHQGPHHHHAAHRGRHLSHGRGQLPRGRAIPRSSGKRSFVVSHGVISLRRDPTVFEPCDFSQPLGPWSELTYPFATDAGRAVASGPRQGFP